MKKLVLVAAISALFCLTACDKTPATTVQAQSAPAEIAPSPATEVDPIKRGTLALDAKYAAQDAFLQHGAPMLDSIVIVLQRAAKLWPESVADDGTDICRKALKLQTVYWINQQDHLNEPADKQLSDLTYNCRAQVGYSYDKERIHRTWDILTGN